MSFIPKIKIFLLLLSVSALTSCVKDIDLNQAGDIKLTPDLQVDLLVFDVEENNFEDPDSGLPRKTIRDTVRLEFLDDDYIQNDLRSLELRFKYINTFSNSFSSSIYFLSEDDALQYQLDFIIAGGNKSSPVITEIVDLTVPNDIGRIRRTIKMVVEIEVLTGEHPAGGILNFQSKGLFSFEF